MSSKTGKALYVDESSAIQILDKTSIPEPAADELLIEIIYSGVNPADIKHGQLLGITSTVLGYDFCGRVIRTPEGSKFATGDIVAGYTPTGIGRPTRYGTHQQYACGPEDLLWKVPENVPWEQAACLTTITTTAADVLFNLFEFPLPSEKGAVKKTLGPLLIWGASASVGFCAVQYARAVGAEPIFVIASPGRHARLKELGATACFDYASPTAVQDVQAAVQAAGRGPIRYALDAVGSVQSPNSADLMASCVDESADVQLASVVLRQDKKFGLPFALKNQDIRLQPKGFPGVLTIPARPEEASRMWEALRWAVSHYGTDFVLPDVRVFKGTAEDALKEMEKVAEGGGGFGKLAVQHPLE